MTSQHFDLFEFYEMQPPYLAEVVKKFEDRLADTASYELVAEFLKAVEEVGYTFDYGLDAQPYGLRPIGVELEELQGW